MLYLIYLRSIVNNRDNYIKDLPELSLEQEGEQALA